MRDPPKFEIAKQEILNLLTGERFYGDHGAAVREAILNSLDACHRYQSLSSDSYDPEILVEFDREESRFIVIDNGDGMGPDEISNLFSRIGKSARDLDTSGAENQVGEFGIGIVSYFLIADSFDVYSKKSDGDSIAFTFSKDMFKPGERAQHAPGDPREDRGTRVVLHLNDDVEIDDLISSYQKWIKDAEEVIAHEQPSGDIVEQGGLPRLQERIEVDEVPPWVEKVDIGLDPNVKNDSNLPGEARVEVLYRGVYLDDRSFSTLWGIRGSIHVSPSEIKPKLNRENFLEEGDGIDLEDFLSRIHPRILTKYSEFAKEKIAYSTRPVEQRRLLTQWMSVPRSKEYDDPRDEWDDVFWDVPIVEQLTPDDREPYSIKALSKLDKDSIYFVKNFRSGDNTIATEAANVLRKTDEFVFTGISSHNSALNKTSPQYNDTGEFLIDEFSDHIPEIKLVDEHKREIIEYESPIIEIFPGDPIIKAVPLGESSEPFVSLSNEIWLNADSDAGADIISYLLDEESRERGLVIACHLYSEQDIQEISSRLDKVGTTEEREIGPVRKSRIREQVL